MSNDFVVRMMITLDDVTPAVSRMIEVPLTIRLDRLHTVFQAALAWTDSHLWELTFGRTGFGIPDPSYGFDGPLDARKATLAEALEGRGATPRRCRPSPTRHMNTTKMLWKPWAMTTTLMLSPTSI